jgi:hypothetical protein
MSASKGNIHPTSWAVEGTFEGHKFDGINVTPLLAEEKVLFSVTTTDGKLKAVEVAPFPTEKQTPHFYQQLMRTVVGSRLQILL